MALSKKKSETSDVEEAEFGIYDIIEESGANAFAKALAKVISEGGFDNNLRRIAKSCFVRRYHLEDQNKMVEQAGFDSKPTDQNMLPPEEEPVPGHIDVANKVQPVPPYTRNPGPAFKLGTKRFRVADLAGKTFTFPGNTMPKQLGNVRGEIRSVDPSTRIVKYVLLSDPGRRGRYQDAYFNGTVLASKITYSSAWADLLDIN